MISRLQLERLAACASLLLVGIALSACANPERVRARQESAQAEREAKNDAQCRVNGIEPGSPAYEQCRERIAAQHAETEAIRAQRSESFQRTLGAGTNALSGH
jgi:hypothetical protein